MIHMCKICCQQLMTNNEWLFICVRRARWRLKQPRPFQCRWIHVASCPSSSCGIIPIRSALMYPALCWNAAALRPTRWSTQRANDWYNDHLDRQLTSPSISPIPTSCSSYLFALIRIKLHYTLTKILILVIILILIIIIILITVFIILITILIIILFFSIIILFLLINLHITIDGLILQVDGEPLLMNPSTINIEYFNSANMLTKKKTSCESNSNSFPFYFHQNITKTRKMCLRYMLVPHTTILTCFCFFV